MAIDSFMSDLDGWGLGNYRTIFSSPFYRQAMQFSLQLLVWGTHIVRTGIMRVYGARLRAGI